MRKLLEMIKFRFLKRKAVRAAKMVNPLVGLPFLMFIDFELGTIFKKGGFAAAKKAVDEWPEKFQKEFGEKLEAIFRPPDEETEEIPEAEKMMNKKWEKGITEIELD